MWKIGCKRLFAINLLLSAVLLFTLGVILTYFDTTLTVTQRGTTHARLVDLEIKYTVFIRTLFYKNHEAQNGQNLRIF